MNPQTNADPNVKQAVPFFAVADIEASLRFDVDGLGSTMTNQWRPEGRRRWCWLQNGGAALMLQEALRQGHGPPPAAKPGEGVTIGFLCEDALAIYHAALERGAYTPPPVRGQRPVGRGYHRPGRLSPGV